MVTKKSVLCLFVFLISFCSLTGLCFSACPEYPIGPIIPEVVKPLPGDFQWYPGHPTQNIDPDQTTAIEVKTINGTPPFTWNVTGIGLTLAEPTTNKSFNILNVVKTGCVVATITVTDSSVPSKTIPGNIHTGGQWVQISHKIDWGSADLGSCEYAGSRTNWSVVDDTTISDYKKTVLRNVSNEWAAGGGWFVFKCDNCMFDCNPTSEDYVRYELPIENGQPYGMEISPAGEVCTPYAGQGCARSIVKAWVFYTEETIYEWQCFINDGEGP